MPTNTGSGLTRCAIYTRVSSEMQAERVSPEVQLSECESHAVAHGYTIVGVYTDTERYRVRGRLVEPSGTRTDRPAFRRLLADGEAGAFDVIIGWKEDRIYRGVRPAVLIDDLIESTGVSVELVKETFDRRMLFLKAAIGKIEIDNIRQRTEMGKLERVRGGMHYGGKVPLGYTAVKDGAGRTLAYAFDPAWREFFTDLARHFLARLSYLEIGRRLGTNPRTGHAWDHSTVAGLLRNPFYRGALAYGWQSGAPAFTVAGQQPPAWDVATCAAIDRELARRAGQVHAPRGIALWSGILRCGYCGRLMVNVVATDTRRKDGIPRHYRSYGCYRPAYVRHGQWAGRPTHAGNFIGELKLMGMVRALVGTLTPEHVDSYIAGIARAAYGPAAPDTARLPRLQAEADALRAKLADLAIGLDGVRHASPAATEALLTVITATGRRLDTVRAEMAELARAHSAAPDWALARVALLRFIEHPETFALPAVQLQPMLRDAFPALYIAGGQIVDAIPAWED